MSSERELKSSSHTFNHDQLKVERKEHRQLQGKKIMSTQQLTQPQIKQRYKNTAEKEIKQNDAFKQLLSRRDKNKQSSSKCQHRAVKKQGNKEQKTTAQNKSPSKSKSKSKGMGKSKSIKQLVKKSKSMVRLMPREKRETSRDQRKSESPNGHGKSTISLLEKKKDKCERYQTKSNYNSKTTRDMVSQLVTERDKSKSKIKHSQFTKTIHHKQKKDQKKKTGLKNKIGDKKIVDKQNKKKGKIGKEKNVIISSQNSKVRRPDNEEWEISIAENDFLESKQKHTAKQTNKDSNLASVPKRKERLSLNSRRKKTITVKNTKTQAEIQSYRSHKKQLEQFAAVTIQKMFRGYLTRKYIRQCFEHNAAVNIQRMWKGYLARKQLKKLRKDRNQQLMASLGQSAISRDKLKCYKLPNHEQYLLQKSNDSAKSNHQTQKWTSILEEILEEEGVNLKIKKKIQQFLISQRKEVNQFDLRSNRSNSARSSMSNQVIHNQITSQRNFITYERLRKEHPQMSGFASPINFKSPKAYKSPQRFYYGSPQSQMNNQKSFLPQYIFSSSPQITSAQLLIQNLKNIQQFHEQRMQSKALNQKEELNNMLIKNKLSPRTHQKKFKQVQLCLQNQLQKFNESINEIVKNCMLYKEESRDDGQEEKPQINQSIKEQNSVIIGDNVLLTPKKEVAHLQLQNQVIEQACSPKLKQVGRDQFKIGSFEQSVELEQPHNYQSIKQIVNAVSFDTGYSFIQEYLISLIDFINTYDDGSEVLRILHLLRSPRSRKPEDIFRNMQTVTEGQQQQDQQNSFRLPLYKYFDLQQQIIRSSVIQQFNSVFTKISLENQTQNLQQHFIKMITDCMNEALNLLRPTLYLFSGTQLSTLNTLKTMERATMFKVEYVSKVQTQFQFMCAQALNKLFFWNKMQWGKTINIQFDENSDRFQQMKAILYKQQEANIFQIEAKVQWEFKEQLMELVGILGKELFQLVLEEEIATIWSVFIGWNERTYRNYPILHLDSGDGRRFHL